MDLLQKYKSVRDLVEMHKVARIAVIIEKGILNIHAIVDSQQNKDKIFEEIKRINGNNHMDINADIKVANVPII